MFNKNRTYVYRQQIKCHDFHTGDGDSIAGRVNLMNVNR